MKFLEAGSTYRFLAGSVSNSIGESASLFTITPAGTLFDCEILSSTEGLNNVFEKNTDIIIETQLELELSDRVYFYQNDFPIEGVIFMVGKNRIVESEEEEGEDTIFHKYKIVLSTETLPEIGVSEFYIEQDVIEIDSEVEAGLYCSQFGELLIVDSGFNLLKLVDRNRIKAYKPAMKDQCFNWQITEFIKNAYDLVMADLGSYEEEFADRFKLLDVSDIISLIEYRAVALFEETMYKDPDRYFVKKYVGELQAYKPRYKKVDGEIKETKGYRIKW